MMIVLGMGKSKQNNMCCLNATDMEKSELRWRGLIQMKDGMHEYDVIKGYTLESAEIEKEIMMLLRVMWNNRQQHERVRKSILT